MDFDGTNTGPPYKRAKKSGLNQKQRNLFYDPITLRESITNFLEQATYKDQLSSLASRITVDSN